MPIRPTVNMRQSTLKAVVTRADGRVEDLGIISYYHKNPLINFAVNMWIKWKDFKRRNK